jgi:hypothetical protein
MSALPPKADIADCNRDVRFVPKADSCTAAKILSFAPCPAPTPGRFDAVLRLSARIYRPFPEPIRQNNVVVEFLRLAANGSVATMGAR